MSRSIDLFFDAGPPPDEVATALGRLLGSNLTEDPETGAWLLSRGEVQAHLTEHRYADDGDLPFTRFRYSLSARVANTVRPQDAPATALLREIADLAQHRLGWPVLLVMDLQYRDQQADAPESMRAPEDVGAEPGDAVALPGDAEDVPAGGADLEPDGLSSAPAGVDGSRRGPERAADSGENR
jgi:hypothetical protein